MQEHIDRIEGWAKTLKEGQAPHQQPLADSALALVDAVKTGQPSVETDALDDQSTMIANLRAHLQSALDDVGKRDDTIAERDEEIGSLKDKVAELEDKVAELEEKLTAPEESDGEDVEGR